MDRNLRFWPSPLALIGPGVWLALIALLTGGARLWHVSARPLHADEAEQAYRLGALLETGRVPTFAHDLHGPLLAYLAWPFARLGGADSYATLEVWMLRGSIVFISLLAFAALWLLRRELGRALPWAALLLAVEPTLNYQARYFIHETALASLGLLGLALAHRLRQSPGPALAVTFGVCLGALLATKLTAILFLPAYLALLFLPSAAAPRTPFRFAFPALAAALATAFLLYSNFARDPAGALLPLQSVLPLLARGGGATAEAAAHVKPWFYHFALLLASWSFWLWSALAALAVFRAAPDNRRLVAGLALFAAVPLLTYSLLPYKTPWLVLGPLTGILLLAAVGLARAHLFPRPVRLALFLAVGCALFIQTRTSLRWCAPAGDALGHAQAYVPTSPALPAAVEPLLDLAHQPGRRVLVVSPDYWPLPWYLRTAPNVGYFEPPATPSAQPRDLLIIEADAWPDHAPLGWRIEQVLPLRDGRTLLALVSSS